MSDLVRIIQQPRLVISPGATWEPVVREELMRYLGERVPHDAESRLRQEAVEILARGTKPGEQSVTAGLVVGYVQSGKTMSFTAATALARDNGFGLVIVIAGTSLNLLDQTQERLRLDLGLDDKAAYRRWVQAKSPKPGKEEASKIEAALEDWLDPDADPAQRASVLVTVMKQHRHLE